MRVLVTGGAGFIGSHVADACLAGGHQVVVVDDLTSGSRTAVNARARWYAVDVRSEEFDAVVAAERPDAITHHAAQVSVRRSVEDPLTDASINVLGTLRVLEAARRHDVGRIVFASTGGAIYGEVTADAADEEHARRPVSPYAIAKLAAEQYLAGYREAHGLRSVVLRYANVYGPRQDPHGEAGVVAIFARRILDGVPPVIFDDGEQTRDFVYIDDVVRANLAALDVPLDGDAPPVFNIATGRGVSVNALWRELAAIASTRLVPGYAPARAGDLRRSVLDPSRAARALEWAPEVALGEGLRRTFNWFAARAARREAA